MSRLVTIGVAVAVVILAVFAWSALDRRLEAVPAANPQGSTVWPTSPVHARLLSRLTGDSDRLRKAELIAQLATPPQVVIIGGSRALRLDPDFIKKRTGLSGFNAAVTCGRPEDAWAFVSLLHARFPGARFRFLWVVHADEFDRRGLDPALVVDPALARFFPQALISSQMRQVRATFEIDPTQRGRVFSRDGRVVDDVFDQLFPHPGADANGVRNNIRLALMTYARTPAQLAPRAVRYFEKSLALMESLAAAPPIVVAAPVDERILAATSGRGWTVRHRLLQRLVARLKTRYTFGFADLSRPASCGCTSRYFFDGIHLRPSGARKVVDTLLRRFPNAIISPGGFDLDQPGSKAS